MKCIYTSLERWLNQVTDGGGVGNTIGIVYMKKCTRYLMCYVTV